LYALPDHQVIMDLIPAITRAYVRPSEAVRRIRNQQGVVPVAIDPADGGRILWADLGDQPFREWQFLYTIEHLAARGAIADAFMTDMDVLLDDALFGATGLEDDGVCPGGFVFHVSRCGSTLLAKALGRAPEHIMISQGGPLQRGFWAWLTDDWRREAAATPETLALFRRLVLAMARRRRPEQQTSFVKFISWNVLYVDFIRQAFPDVPCLFLYRDPVEVIASVLRETTAALEVKGTREAAFLTGAPAQQTATMDDTSYLAHCYARYFEVALRAADKGLRVLNYTGLSPRTFPDILDRGLGFRPSRETLALMLEQFRFHSKDDSNSTEFRADSAEKRAALTGAERRAIETTCSGLLAQLDQSSHNLFADLDHAASTVLSA